MAYVVRSTRSGCISGRTMPMRAVCSTRGTMRYKSVAASYTSGLTQFSRWTSMCCQPSRCYRRNGESVSHVQVERGRCVRLMWPQGMRLAMSPRAHRGALPICAQVRRVLLSVSCSCLHRCSACGGGNRYCQRTDGAPTAVPHRYVCAAQTIIKSL